MHYTGMKLSNIDVSSTSMGGTDFHDTCFGHKNVDRNGIYRHRSEEQQVSLLAHWGASVLCPWVPNAIHTAESSRSVISWRLHDKGHQQISCRPINIRTNAYFHAAELRLLVTQASLWK